MGALADGSGAHVAIVIQELNGGQPLSWSKNATDLFVAASTYKLPVLEAEAEGMAAGLLHPNDSICYQESDFEDGPYGDYADGFCYSRLELARRIGQASDNTAAHMLVRDLGGTAALDAYAASHGATHSTFFDPNLTMAADLARLWVEEAQGRMGGAAAQKILYPLLTGTWYESGIPGGARSPMTVVHKVGMIDSYHHDAALVLGGPHRYVLVVCTEGLGEDAAWALMAKISAEVSRFESRA